MRRHLSISMQSCRLPMARLVSDPFRISFRFRNYRPVMRYLTSATSVDSRIKIQDITVAKPLEGSGRLDLVPPLDLRFLGCLPRSFETTLRWMLQKDFVLGQDFCLLGHSAADRRLLAFGYAAITSREVEYIAVTRDTSDADLKQRKVIEDGISQYVDQGPVRAARNGRLLILDGIEKAERNVLPTLNNLLENRSLSLDDGSLLVDSKAYKGHDHSNSNVDLYQVHDDFRVLALGSADEASSLDPPLRSRFQAYQVPNLDAGELLDSLVQGVDATKIPLNQIEALVQSSLQLTPVGCFSSLTASASYLEQNPTAHVNAVLRGTNGEGLQVSDNVLSDGGETVNSPIQPSAFVETPSSLNISSLLTKALLNKRGVVLVGPKGCGKSALVKQHARSMGMEAQLFSLVADTTARDLFLRRSTNESGDTVWLPTPLTKAAESGSWVFLDGIDKLHMDTLTSLGQLMQFGYADLPDGRRLMAKNGFACVALGHPPSTNSWISSEVAAMFHWIRMDHLPTDELQKVLTTMFPQIRESQLQALVRCRNQLDAAILSGAADTRKEEESIVLSLRKLKHICKRLQRNEHHLSGLVCDALMTDLMPDRSRQVVMDCMADSGIALMKRELSGSRKTCLDEELLNKCRRKPKNRLLVPSPRFEMNPAHQEALNGLLEAHAVDERAILVMGYQGVGKNKVVDYLLEQLDCEREYVQLHRDTTVQSMLSTPSVENGRIVHHDSPLVRAATYGRILVIDEADKAPVEVVAMLKGLVEDGELALADGRTLRYEPDGNIMTVVIHPDFKVWALANPTGYPFHGNDLAREMSDIFSCHTISPLDVESQTRVLSSYGPNVSEEDILKIVKTWSELGLAHSKGLLSYPFSVREAVSVVKHLNEFPEDGIAAAIENVVAFDRYNQALMNILGSILSKHGVTISLLRKPGETAGATGGISTPRTRAGEPKHGKVDPDNTPHVGGNTWYGGTGGSDTAGLGGRGGPYRVDLGHPIHQVSDEMKTQVTKESMEKARAIAAEELAKKLEALNMGDYDWERYNGLRDRVALQIEQLRVHLRDVRLRNDQRIWLKRQTTGELDDSRLCETLAGEKDVFKRRGLSDDSHFAARESPTPIRVKLVVDISASMYRFNGFDGRLERLLESTLMIMEALKDDERFLLEITGHNGSDAQIHLLDGSMEKDEATQLRILQGMIAHTQYTYAGDQTLAAIETIMSESLQGDLVLLISDANLNRYRIEPEDVANALLKTGVHSHLILISSLGQEAYDIADQVPNGRAQVCLDSSELPLMLKRIIASAVAA